MSPICKGSKHYWFDISLPITKSNLIKVVEFDCPQWKLLLQSTLFIRITSGKAYMQRNIICFYYYIEWLFHVALTTAFVYICLAYNSKFFSSSLLLEVAVVLLWICDRRLLENIPIVLRNNYQSIRPKLIRYSNSDWSTCGPY